MKNIAPLLCVFSVLFFSTCDTTTNFSPKEIKIDCLGDLDIAFNESLNSILAKYPNATKRKNIDGTYACNYYYGDGNLEFGYGDTIFGEYVLNTVALMEFDEQEKLKTFKLVLGCFECSFNVTPDYQHALKVLRENRLFCLEEFNLPKKVKEPFSLKMTNAFFDKKLDTDWSSFNLALERK